MTLSSLLDYDVYNNSTETEKLNVFTDLASYIFVISIKKT